MDEGRESVMANISAAFGAEHVAPRAAHLRDELIKAASVGLLDIDENEKVALEKIKAEAGEKRGKIKKAVADMEAMSDMALVRKFWAARDDNLFLHFVGDRTKVGQPAKEAA